MRADKSDKTDYITSDNTLIIVDNSSYVYKSRIKMYQTYDVTVTRYIGNLGWYILECKQGGRGCSIPPYFPCFPRSRNELGGG